jgi:glycosyltransferase involved in cell wall biosynthesis
MEAAAAATGAINEATPITGVSARRFTRRRAPRVTVVVPTLNEERNLPFVIAALPIGVDELVLVDAQSTDGTVAIARELWPDVRIVEQHGRGKGDALALGFAAATGDIIVTIDGDGSTDPAEIPKFVAALVGGADMAKGTRFAAGGGSDDLTPVRRLGARRLTTLVNVLFGTEFTDLCYGFNAFWRECLPSLVTPAGFEVETSMHISAARAGLAIVEVPSFERERLYGASNLRTFRDGSRVLRTILAARFSAAPAPEPAPDPAPARI